MKILPDHSLLKFNTFGIDVKAREFVEIDRLGDLREIIAECNEKVKKMLILGGGSNVLFTGDYNGLLVRISTRGKEIVHEDDSEVHLRVAAGENWDDLVGFCVEQGWGGLENLSGIPGLTGSSPIQNIGAYGVELKDVFLSLEAINTCTGETVVFDSERCQFGYRDSIFKRALKGRIVITHVHFRLQKNPVVNISYRALADKFVAVPVNEISIGQVRQAVKEIRDAKLPDPVKIGNAGSFYKNPVVSESKLEDLKRIFPGIVNFGTKLSAGWLVEQCGWKGYREGDAGVHKDQALVLVNYGNATGRQILDLANKIQESVKEKFGIVLEREVNLV